MLDIAPCKIYGSIHRKLQNVTSLRLYVGTDVHERGRMKLTARPTSFCLWFVVCKLQTTNRFSFRFSFCGFGFGTKKSLCACPSTRTGALVQKRKQRSETRDNNSTTKMEPTIRKSHMLAFHGGQVSNRHSERKVALKKFS